MSEEYLHALKIAFCYMPKAIEVNKYDYGDRAEKVLSDIQLVRDALLAQGIDPEERSVWRAEPGWGRQVVLLARVNPRPCRSQSTHMPSDCESTRSSRSRLYKHERADHCSAALPDRARCLQQTWDCRKRVR
jgi:hypothetical protein